MTGTRSLPSLPVQPEGVSWPTERWPESRLDARPGVDVARIESAVKRCFGPDASEELGETHALLLVYRGELVLERYDAERGPDVTCISWSMAKSVLHALVGILVRERRLDVSAPAPVPAWQAPGDPRREITLDQLLRMADGLEFLEDYIEGHISNVIEMLFQKGKDDVAGYAESRPPAHPPGSVWNYSSGTSNVVAAIVGRSVGGGAAGMLDFMQRELFRRIGMTSAVPRFDAAGTFIGSSYIFATARDFARFGLLYLRDGLWDGQRILPEGWVDYARTDNGISDGQYGAHWWLATDGSGIFHASGYRGQYIAVDPRRDLVMVRLGGSIPDQRGAVYRVLREIDRSFPALD